MQTRKTPNRAVTCDGNHNSTRTNHPTPAIRARAIRDRVNQTRTHPTRSQTSQRPSRRPARQSRRRMAETRTTTHGRRIQESKQRRTMTSTRILQAREKHKTTKNGRKEILKNEYKNLARRLDRTPSLSDIRLHAHELTYGPKAYAAYPITRLAREVGLQPNKGSSCSPLPDEWEG